ncbi:MAG TPA: hypothetical protein VHW26_13335 [Solirubrobacteraceae bacterium]|nr:hypothetical protein [Solirubrobacteraceae bacterium]
MSSAPSALMSPTSTWPPQTRVPVGVGMYANGPVIWPFAYGHRAYESSSSSWTAP